MKIDINDPELRIALREATLEQLAPFAALLATKIREYRQSHNGFVPPEFFLTWLGIAGVYYCCDILVWTKENYKKFWLKKRKSSEINPKMVGKYQIVGSVGVNGQSAEKVLTRSLIEVFGSRPALVETYLHQILLIGAEIHPESWRDCTCLSLLFEIEIENTSYLDGEWLSFNDPTDSRIVRHQQETLQWRLSPTFRPGKFITLPGSPD